MDEGKADIALIGLAVMGQNLILNMNDHGFVVCAYNRTIAKVTDFLSKEAKDTNIIGASSLRDMVSKLKKPRKVMLLVKAGVAVDEFVKNLIPLLEKGDIIIDGGNSQYIVTQRWCKELDATGIFYVGVGTQKSLFNTKWTIDLCRPALLLSASEANKEDLKEATILHPRLEAVVQDPEYRCMLHEPEGFTRIQTQKSLFNTKWTIDLCRPALLLSASEANKEDLKEATILHPRLEAVVQDPEYRCMLHEPEGFTRIQVSGGEDGARYGPSLMPGGHSAAWPHVKPIFQAICAKVNNEPCCDWVGEDGAGHFVKMVHNGIEYGDMQLICEAYSLMKAVLGMEQDEMAQVFEEWNRGELNSFLIEITRDILKFKDADGKYLLPKIRDTAGQKGTGKWTGITALEYGVPVTLIGEAVFARCLSSIKDERVKASHVLPGSSMKFTGNKKEFLEHLRKALYASKIISYAQGFMLLREAAKVNNWNLNYGSIALMWRGGCIIRSVFLGNIKEAFTKNCALTNLLLDPYFCREISSSQGSLRQVMAQAALVGVPAPAFAAALSFYDGYRSSVLPANLLQAQRDYFGAHMYELLSKPGEFVHTNWTGYGGNVSASTYNN